MSTKDENLSALRNRYGDVLTMSDLAAVLRYPSVGAIRKARERGRLPITPVRIPHRRGWFVTATAVAELLHGLEGGEAHHVQQQPKEGR